MYSLKNKVYVFLFIAVFSACAKDGGSPDIQLQLLQAVNSLREKGCQCGTVSMPPVAPLTWNRELEVAARSYATEMYQHQFFSHIGLDGSAPINRAKLAGYQGDYVAENIGKGYSTVSQVVQAWQQSESHCKAMMDSLYTDMGAAEYKTYWVMELGK